MDRDPRFDSLKKFPGLILMLLLAALLAACNLPRATPIPPTDTPMPTDTAVPSPTPTSLAPVASPPLPSPTQNTSGTITNLLFAPGTTAVVAAGNLQPNQSQTFTLEAGQNQAMILILNSDKGDAYLSVYEPNGNVLLDPAKKWSSWQWLLPQTELYTIKVNAGASGGAFVLTAKVAARLTFQPGSTTLTVNGSTPKGYVISYAVHALAGQTMSVTVSAPGFGTSLDIFGLAYGEVLVGASANALTWTGKLPSSEDYIIEVIPAAGQVINFTLTINIK